MPKRRLVTHAHTQNIMELHDELDVLHGAEVISRNQRATLLHLLLPRLPVSFVVEMRSPKGAIYVVTSDGEHLINNRAKLQRIS